MLENAGMTLEQCEGIGIGSPGTIDAKRGVILYSSRADRKAVPDSIRNRSHISVPTAPVSYQMCIRDRIVPASDRSASDFSASNGESRCFFSLGTW